MHALVRSALMPFLHEQGKMPQGSCPAQSGNPLTDPPTSVPRRCPGQFGKGYHEQGEMTRACTRKWTRSCMHAQARSE